MKLEEKRYLYELKEKDGKSKKQIKLELLRDEKYQEKLNSLKKNKKKKHKQTKEKARNVNKKFKQGFGQLK